MAPISALPIEAMLLILSHLNVADKAAMTLTCQSLREVTVAALYEDIDFEWPKGGRLEDNPPIHLLLRTILESPERAREIMTVRLAGSKYDTTWQESEKFKFNGSESLRVQRVAQEAGFSSLLSCDGMPATADEWHQSYTESLAELHQALSIS